MPRFGSDMIWPDWFETLDTLVGQMLCQPVVDAIDAKYLLNYRDTVIVITPEYIKPLATKFSILQDWANSLSQKPYEHYLNHLLQIWCDRNIAASARPDDELRKWNSRQGGLCLGKMEFWLEYIGLCLLHLTEAKAVVSIRIDIFCFIERL